MRQVVEKFCVISDAARRGHPIGDCPPRSRRYCYKEERRHDVRKGGGGGTEAHHAVVGRCAAGIKMRPCRTADWSRRESAVPGPLFVKPLVPASGAVSAIKFVLTTTDGDRLEPVSSVNTLPPPEVRVQLWLPEGRQISPAKLRGVSKVTVRSAVRASVLKSAVLPGPLATMPPSHWWCHSTGHPHRRPTFRWRRWPRPVGTAVVNRPTIWVLKKHNSYRSRETTTRTARRQNDAARRAADYPR